MVYNVGGECEDEGSGSRYCLGLLFYLIHLIQNNHATESSIKTKAAVYFATTGFCHVRARKMTVNVINHLQQLPEKAHREGRLQIIQSLVDQY